MEITASNAIFLEEETGGKGRQFRARFLVPGLVKYDYGVCLLTKENADKFIQGFTGCPVVINHQDVTDENVKEVAAGDIFSVWFDEKDGYYWCNGIIRDKKAIELINQGYSVSCQYVITEYSDNTEGKLHNGNPYDKVIENGRPEHLAIVNNPRYEGANIAVNAINKGTKARGQEGNKTETGDILNSIPEEPELKLNNDKGLMPYSLNALLPSRNDIPDLIADTIADTLAEGIVESLGELIASNEDKWITIKPNGEDAKGKHLLVKEGETPSDAVRRVYGDKNQKTLFDTKGYKKTKEDFKKEAEEKQKEYDKIEERHKETEDLYKEKADKKKKDDALLLSEDEFVSKYFDKEPGNSIWKLYDYWREKRDEEKIKKAYVKEAQKGGMSKKEAEKDYEDSFGESIYKERSEKEAKDDKHPSSDFFKKLEEQHRTMQKDASEKEKSKLLDKERLKKYKEVYEKNKKWLRDNKDLSEVERETAKAKQEKLLDEIEKMEKAQTAANSFIDELFDTLYKEFADRLGE